ncbi:hypothetical protein Acr_29g0000010, partial [Actinidia rufa]
MWTLLLLLLVPEVVAPRVVLTVFQPLVLNPLVQSLGLMSALCHATDHCLLTCLVRVFKHYRQRGPGHYSDLPTLVQQILSAFSNPFTALSASTGSADGSDSWDRPSFAQTMLKNTMIPPSLPLYEHKALFPTDLAL